MISLELYVFLLKLFHILERIFPKICVVSQQLIPPSHQDLKVAENLLRLGRPLSILLPF